MSNYRRSDDNQKAKNAQASLEGRALYVRGIPPDWSQGKLTDFFNHQGVVESVNLMPPKPGQNALAAFINFKFAQDAETAAQICDDLPVEANAGTTFRLSCSLKRAPNQKVEMISGFSSHSKAQQEKRSVFINGMPKGFISNGLRELIAPYAYIEDISPVGKLGQACFAIAATAEQAEQLIEKLHGTWIGESELTVNYPRPPKRLRQGENSAWIVEVTGFPPTALPTDLSYLVEAGGHEVYTVEVQKRAPDQEPLAHIYLKSEEDIAAVVEQLNGMEAAFGTEDVVSFTLQASSLCQKEERGEPQAEAAAPVETPAKRKRAHPVANPKASAPVVQPRRKGPAIGMLRTTGAAAPVLGPRCRGDAVGVLLHDGAACAFVTAPEEADESASRASSKGQSFLAWPAPLPRGSVAKVLQPIADSRASSNSVIPAWRSQAETSKRIKPPLPREPPSTKPAIRAKPKPTSLAGVNRPTVSPAPKPTSSRLPDMSADDKYEKPTCEFADGELW